MLGDIVTTQELAEYLRLTPERVQQLVKENILEPCDQKREKGKGYLFDAEIAVQSYIEYLQAFIKKNKRGNEDKEAADLRKAIADADWKERQAEKLALDVERMKNNLHEADIVEGYIGQFVSFIRAQIEAAPGRAAKPVLEAAGIVPKKRQELAAIRILEAEMDCVLRTLSEFEYNPEELASRDFTEAPEELDEDE